MQKLKLILIISLFNISSCVSRNLEHGYEINRSAFKSLVLNVSTKEQVLNKLGSPSNVSSLNENEWYYIFIKTHKLSIFQPEVVNNETVKLKFLNNKVIKIEFFHNDIPKKLTFNKNEIMGEGSRRNALQDYIHAFSKSNKPKKK